MTTEYYYISGPYSHLMPLRYHPGIVNHVAKTIAGAHVFRREDGAIELVLGLTSFGASYLLMSKEQLDSSGLKLSFSCPDSKPCHVQDYASLSPIAFADAQQLYNKLLSLKPKYKRIYKDDTGRSIVIDDSPANGHYVRTGMSTHSLSRAHFEQQRMLHRLLLNNIDSAAYGVKKAHHWQQNMTVWALAFNPWLGDSRRPSEIQSAPRVMDVGFCPLDRSQEPLQPDASQIRHLALLDQRTLGMMGLKRAQPESGFSEMIDAHSASCRLQAWADSLGPDARSPTVVLVWDVIATMAMLHTLGVNTGRFLSSTTDLFYPTPAHGARRTPSPPNRKSKSKKRRPRRSPSPPDVLRDTNVYLVDVKSMWSALFHMISPKRIREAAPDLGVSVDESEWCAGTESKILLDMWVSMVEGPAIDEQFMMRRQSLEQQQVQVAPPVPSTESGSGSGTPAGDNDDDDDDDVDPNDIVPVSAAVAPAQVNDNPYDHANWSEDEDE